MPGLNKHLLPGKGTDHSPRADLAALISQALHSEETKSKTLSTWTSLLRQGQQKQSIQMGLPQTKRTVKETINRKGNWKGEDIFK